MRLARPHDSARVNMHRGRRSWPCGSPIRAFILRPARRRVLRPSKSLTSRLRSPPCSSPTRLRLSTSIRNHPPIRKSSARSPRARSATSLIISAGTSARPRLCPNAPHPHVERRYLVVPGLRSSRIYIMDTKPDPRAPKIVKVIEPSELADKTGYTRPHAISPLAGRRSLASIPIAIPSASPAEIGGRALRMP